MTPKDESDPFYSMRSPLFQSHVFHCKLIASGMCGVPVVGIHSEASTCKCFTAGEPQLTQPFIPRGCGLGDSSAVRLIAEARVLIPVPASACGAVLDKPCQLPVCRKQIRPCSPPLETTGDLWT